MRYRFLIVLCGVLALGSGPLVAQEEAVAPDTVQLDTIPPPAPVSNLTAEDTENDHGHSVTLTWEPSADDRPESPLMYEIYRWAPFFMDTLAGIHDSIAGMESAIAELEAAPAADKQLLKQYRQRLRDLRKERAAAIDRIPEAHRTFPDGGEWRNIGKGLSGQTSYTDVGVKDKESGDYMADFTDYYYRVDVVGADPTVRTVSEIVGPVQSYGQLFNTGRVPVLVAVLVFGSLTVLFITRAKRGAELYVRPLAGIDAVDDAIGRATEMGKPILYVLGLGTAADIATIASFTILGRVARRVAEYQTELIVPCYDPIVMTVAQETVKAGFMDAGRPDAYNDDIVYFVTQSQFAYTAAVNGTMLRQLPATNVYMGKFFAESLLLAETGAQAGSIQISGTDEIAQLPFFIVACDYTLIGEELYAASAYLGREPLLLGSLKAQDYAKAAVIFFAILGIIFANLGWTEFTAMFRVGN